MYEIGRLHEPTLRVAPNQQDGRQSTDTCCTPQISLEPLPTSIGGAATATQVVEATVVTTDPRFSSPLEGEDVLSFSPYSPPSVPPRRRSRLRLLIIPGVAFLVIALLLSLLLTRVLPALNVTASVTVVPAAAPISATVPVLLVSGHSPPGSGEVAGRSLAPLTLSQTLSGATTGIGHQIARQAQGSITFYNSLPSWQTVGANTVLSGADGVQVITDAPAVIPPAVDSTPPIDGYITVSARAVAVGPQGNIPVRDVNGPCCLAYVLAQNTAAFWGGQNERTYPAVAQKDTAQLRSSASTSLLRLFQTAFQSQLRSSESLVVPMQCSSSAKAIPAVGEEATQVSVTVTESCATEAYDTQNFSSVVMQALDQQARQSLGAGFLPSGDMQYVISGAQRLAGQSGEVRLEVLAKGTWVYHMSPAQQSRLAQLIAGKSKSQATQIIERMARVRSVNIAVSGGDGVTLPGDVARITFILL